MNLTEQALGITNVSFKDENTIILELSNKRFISIPLDDFPEITVLSNEEKEDFQIIDDEYLSFVEMDEIYSLKELIGLQIRLKQSPATSETHTSFIA
ncbi:MAG: hypothetical protein V5804_11190 [Mucilaginibacter sp.]|uniref:hypothetical protein n=1 Tax=Mucilaginibacter sp. TaxID=1882438 RepID=UPI0034E3E9E9